MKKPRLPLDQKTIAKLKKVLAKEPEVLAAYLFGSQITGRAKPDSDLDLAIAVTDRIKKEEFYFLKKVAGLNLGDFHLSVVDLQNSAPLFLHQIIKGGVPIFKRSERERISFESQAALRYFDTQYLRDVQNYYLGKRIKEGSYGY
jgi:predicted nucleotidyltransferase